MKPISLFVSLKMYGHPIDLGLICIFWVSKKSVICPCNIHQKSNPIF